MKNTNIKLLLGLLFSLFLISFISASVSVLTPASSATVSASASWNASGTAFGNIMNCTIWVGSSSLTANTTMIAMNKTSNSSANALWLNGAFDSTQFEDANDYQVLAQCTNLTNVQQNSSANTAITIHNTSPTAPSSLTPTAHTLRTTSGTPTFSSTVTDRETTSCTYAINRAGSSTDVKSSSGTATYSGSTCSFTKTFSSSNDNGIYLWTITASDETQTTKSSEGIYEVQFPGSGGGLPQTPTSQSKSNKTLLIIGIVIFFIWLITKKK